MGSLMTDNFRGALLMSLSMAAFVLNDTFMKLTLETLPFFQTLFVRGIMTSVLVGLLCYYLNAFKFHYSRRDWGFILLRAIAEVASAYFFLTALKNMPIANASAILQLLPLTVTVGALIFFREKIGWRRGLAIFIGFCGMLLMLQPKANGFDDAALYALIAVVGVTFRELATRSMSREVSSVFATFVTVVAVLLFASVMSINAPWEPISNAEMMQISCAAVIVSIGYLLSVMVMRVGDMAHVAFFRYTGLLWALLIGFFVFGDWPKPLTLVGALMIVAAGAFTMWRDHALKKKRTTL